MGGKAIIVCMSRRICVDLYEALIKLWPDWASAKDDGAVAAVCHRRPSGDTGKGGHRPPLQAKACVVKVIMTGSAEDGSSAPTARDMTAQGSALGMGRHAIKP